MKLRILTNDNFIDIEPINVDEDNLMQAIDEGNTIAMKTSDGNVFILNTINVVGIIVSHETNIPPISQ